jgi:hypothetical protein
MSLFVKRPDMFEGTPQPKKIKRNAEYAVRPIDTF